MKNTKMATKKIKIILSFVLLILPFQIFSSNETKPEAAQTETTSQIDEITIKQPDQSTNTVQSTENQTEKPKEEKADLFLNFENLNLSNVVSYLGEQKKINIIPNNNLDAIPVTLSTRNPLTLERSWNILLTLLDLNNYTLINVDKLYRIVPKAQKEQEPLPAYSSATGTEPENLPDTDLAIRYLYFMHNIKAETVQSFLTTMLEGAVQINKDLDVCLITDKCMNIKAAMKIITELDQGGLRQAMTILPLEYADVDEVAKLFNEQITPKDKQQRTIQFLGPTQKKPSTYFSTDTKIYPDTRKNSLILLGTEKSIAKLIDFIKKFIDTPIQSAKSRIHIKELKYAKAVELKKIIPLIIKSPEGAIKALQVGQYKYFEDVLIEADSFTGEKDKNVIGGGGNRLIISCNKDDWKRLEKLIDKLDKPQPQIAFEVLIIDAEIQNWNELWSQIKPKTPNMIGMGVNAQFRNSQANTGDVNLISKDIIGTNLTFGKAPGPEQPVSLWAMIKAILTKQNFNIITQPFIITNNHKECSVVAAEERMIESALERNVGVQVARQKKPYSANTSVTLTPHVNLDGVVDLTIKISIQNFTTTTQTDPDANTRDLTTRVSMLTGEVLVLGGLTRSFTEEDCYKTPILGDIPIIGNLFKSKTLQKKENNLYVFIRPSIINPRLEGAPDEYTQLKLDYAKYQMLNADMYTKSKDPIQRWFFKPTDQSSKEKLTDSRSGILRSVDDYTYGKNQPKEVDIKNDPYYRAKEEIKSGKEENKANTEKKILTKKTRKLKSRHNNT